MVSTAASYFKSVCLLVLTPQCYDEFFIKYNFLNVPCLKAAVSKGLGYGIVAGSVMVKVPQVKKIWDSGSAKGVSLVAVLLDLSAITANAVYSFVLAYPFSAWGEGLFLSLQTAAIAFLVFAFDVSRNSAYVFIATFVATVAVLASGLTPIAVLTFLQSMCIPVVIAGKSMQILVNYRNGSTGQLSAVTVMMLLGGSVARIFTSLQETGDTLLVVTYMVAALLNAVTAAQMLYYWNVPADGKTIKDGKKKKK